MNFFEFIVHFLTGYHDSTSMERFLGSESRARFNLGIFRWFLEPCLARVEVFRKAVARDNGGKLRLMLRLLGLATGAYEI